MKMLELSTNQSIDINECRQSDEDREIQYRNSVRKSCPKMLILLIIILVISIVVAFWDINELQDKIFNLNKLLQTFSIRLSRLERREYLLKLQNDYRHNSAFTDKINAIRKSTASAINLSSTNEAGIIISQSLYETQFENIQRKRFNEQRQIFIETQNKPTLHLTKYNLIENQGAEIEALIKNAQQWERLNKKYNLSTIKRELSFCIIVPGYNNRANYRIEYNLNSLFTQNYTNYRAVIINDASNDGSDQLYQNYFEFLAVPKDKYAYFFNRQRLTALQNLYNGIVNKCQNYQIIMTLDADDQLIGRNILQTFNAVYQKQTFGVVYSNFYLYQQNVKIQLGFTKQYSDQQKMLKQYRQIDARFSHLRSFRRDLFMQIELRDLKDKDGKFYKITYDVAMFMPLLELACGKILKIDEVNYLYNVQTGINDYSKDKGVPQEIINIQIRKKPKYNCSRRYQ